MNTNNNSSNQEVVTKEKSSSSRIPSTIQSAFPLLSGPIETTTTASIIAPGVVQILVAAYIAHRYYPTGLISGQDIAFCILFPTYLCLANRVRFQNNLVVRNRPNDHPHSSTRITKEFFTGNAMPWFQKYMVFAAFVGLLVPLCFTICTTTMMMSTQQQQQQQQQEQGQDYSGMADLAIPHMFVLWIQIIGESITMFNPMVHRYITLILPIGFSCYRMKLLVEWFQRSLSLLTTNNHTEQEALSSCVAVAIAGINLLFWTYNLFVTLLLRITPEYLDTNKCESPEMAVINLLFIKEELAPVAHKKKKKHL